jgi:UDP-3-O-[3-hydroxymyristoyl] glucosamine N-acyltransferase
VIPIGPTSLAALARELGGELRSDARVHGAAPVDVAGPGEIAPLLSLRYLAEACAAAGRGAALLVEGALATDPRVRALGGWVHAHAAWALACVLDRATVELAPARMGSGCTLGANVVLERGVVLGDRVTVGAGTVIGRPGFGWATGPDGKVRAVPQLGGVHIDDDVVVGPLCTIDGGTLGPTVLRRRVKLDAQVHIAHNCHVGEDTIVAAQSGFAGSVRIGRGVLIGGQVGIADHVRVGDGARIAAKSGVIGDVPAGATVAGYPAVARARWLRGLATMYRTLRGEDG